MGITKLRRTARAVGAARNTGASGQGRHHSGRRDLANGVVAHIRNIEIAVCIRRRSFGLIKLRRTARAVGGTRDTGASGERYHRSAGHDLADGVVACVRDINVAVCIHGDTFGLIKPRSRARAVVAASNTGASSQGRHNHRPTGCRVGVAVVLRDAVDHRIEPHINGAPVGGEVGERLAPAGHRRAEEVIRARRGAHPQGVGARAVSRVPREGRRAGSQRAARRRGEHLRQLPDHKGLRDICGRVVIAISSLAGGDGGGS